MNDHRALSLVRIATICAISLVLPVVITTAYLWVSRSFALWNWSSGLSDFLAIGVSVLVGLTGVAMLRMGRAQKIVVAALYAVLAFGGLIVWTILAACSMFGACL